MVLHVTEREKFGVLKESGNSVFLLSQSIAANLRLLVNIQIRENSNNYFTLRYPLSTPKNGWPKGPLIEPLEVGKQQKCLKLPWQWAKISEKVHTFKHFPPYLGDLSSQLGVQKIWSLSKESCRLSWISQHKTIKIHVVTIFSSSVAFTL